MTQFNAVIWLEIYILNIKIIIRNYLMNNFTYVGVHYLDGHEYAITVKLFNNLMIIFLMQTMHSDLQR